jgi:hypothetical protein
MHDMNASNGMMTRPSDDGDSVGGMLSPGAVLHVTGLDPSSAWLQVDLKGATAWLKREVSQQSSLTTVDLQPAYCALLDLANNWWQPLL